MSALVEPSNGGTDSFVPAEDDDAYGDVKIYDVRNGTTNDIRVSYLSALNENEDGEEPIYSEVTTILYINEYLCLCLILYLSKSTSQIFL